MRHVERARLARVLQRWRRRAGPAGRRRLSAVSLGGEGALGLRQSPRNLAASLCLCDSGPALCIGVRESSPTRRTPIPCRPSASSYPPDPRSSRHAPSRVRELAIPAVCLAVLGAVLVSRGTSGATPLRNRRPMRSRTCRSPDLSESPWTRPSELRRERLTFPPDRVRAGIPNDGSVLVAAEKGAAAFYDADDPACTPHRLQAGTGTVEMPGHVAITRNEGNTPLVLHVVFLVPSGGAPSTQQPRPGNRSLRRFCLVSNLPTSISERFWLVAALPAQFAERQRLRLSPIEVIPVTSSPYWRSSQDASVFVSPPSR